MSIYQEYYFLFYFILYFKTILRVQEHFLTYRREKSMYMDLFILLLTFEAYFLISIFYVIATILLV